MTCSSSEERAEETGERESSSSVVVMGAILLGSRFPDTLLKVAMDMVSSSESEVRSVLMLCTMSKGKTC